MSAALKLGGGVVWRDGADGYCIGLIAGIEEDTFPPILRSLRSLKCVLFRAHSDLSKYGFILGYVRVLEYRSLLGAAQFLIASAIL